MSRECDFYIILFGKVTVKENALKSVSSAIESSSFIVGTNKINILDVKVVGNVTALY